MREIAQKCNNSSFIRSQTFDLNYINIKVWLKKDHFINVIRYQQNRNARIYSKPPPTYMNRQCTLNTKTGNKTGKEREDEEKEGKSLTRRLSGGPL